MNRSSACAVRIEHAIGMLQPCSTVVLSLTCYAALLVTVFNEATLGKPMLDGVGRRGECLAVGVPAVVGEAAMYRSFVLRGL